MKGYGLTADMLAPNGFGEITSGGMREDNNLSITKKMEKEGLDIKNYQCVLGPKEIRISSTWWIWSWNRAANEMDNKN